MDKLQNMELERGAGVLMPISALPSPYGIGTLGEEAYFFVDFLKRIGCRYWQVLPVGPTSYGDSPYQSYSAFAGNPYFIDLDNLINEKLLDRTEVEELNQIKVLDHVDYEKLYQIRFCVLRKAFSRSRHYKSKQFIAFCEKNSFWLEDYSLYMAVKNHFGNKDWLHWDDNIKYRKNKALDKYRKLLEEDIQFWKFCQYKFSVQWNKLKKYANKIGIQIIGDIPLYVACDSCDVWVHSELFELDKCKNPINVAGVPPDAFSDTGQRWGNPLYRWNAMEKNNFTWWRERMKTLSRLYDVIRIDHFIGIVNYYSIPAGEKTAVEGRWRKGPGKKLTDAIKESTGNTRIIAEDLGIITPKVRALINESGFPSMKILEFGLQGPADHEYLPHNYKSTNLIAYTGTHDNETLVGYLNNRSEEELAFTYRYFNVTKKEQLPYAIIRVMYASISDVVIVQMQDLLLLDNRARMNFPSTVGINWKWRMTKNQYKELNENLLKKYADIFARTPKE